MEFIMSTETPLLTNQHLCKNCDTELQGEYCHHCGQQDKQYIRSIFAVVGDLFGEIGHWDSRFYRTLTGLLFKPAFLSLEFVRGRHASYVPPLRLYFFISLISFMVLTSLIDFEFRSAQPQDKEVLAQVQDDLDQNLPNPIKPLIDENGEVKPPTVSLGDMTVPWMDEAEKAELEAKMQYLLENPAQLSQKLVSMTPQMMLLMLPFWALVLKFIYLFGHRYYLEHLTVALHTHAFILLMLMLVTIVSSLTTPLLSMETWSWLGELGDWITNGLLLWLVLYIVLTQKHFYQQGWGMTVFKFMLSGVVYLILLAVSFVIMVIIGILNS
jgi:hypothetical protein